MATEPDASTPEELELEAALNRQKIAEAELAEATAKQSLQRLVLPDTVTAGLDGSITANDGAGYFSQLLAYQVLDDLTDHIAGTIAAKIDGKDVIVSHSFKLGDQFTLWSIVDARLTNVPDASGRLAQRLPG